MLIESILFLVSLMLCGAILYVLGQLWFVDTRNRKLRSLFVLGITVSVWTLLNPISMLVAPEYSPFLITIRMITVCIIPYSLLWFFLNYSASKLAHSKIVMFFLFFVPALDILTLITNPFHLLYFTEYSNSRSTSGPLFWVHMVLAYVTVLLAFYVLIRHTIRYIKEKPALVWAAVGTLLPYVLNILFTLNAPGFKYDLTPFGFFVAFMILAWLSYRTRLLNIKTNAFTNIFAALDNIIMIADMDHTLVDFNRALNKFFPDFEVEAGKTTIGDFLEYLSPRINSSSIDQEFNPASYVHDDKLIEGELELLTPDGLKTFTINRRPIQSGRRTTGYVLDLSDISEYRAMIVEIDEQNRRLTELKDLAESASEAKGTFLSNMSHEIRTPMNAILGMTTIADSTDDIGRIRYCLDTIKTSSAHLLGLINDVLDMSKIEAGKLELENYPFNLERMMMKISNIIIDKTEAKRQCFSVVFQPGMHLHYSGDEMRLSQVITNLLSNAIKFTPEDGSITVSLETVKSSGDLCVLRVSVQDTGIGMTGEQIGKLFKSFSQADGSITRRFGGTGLGLTISKSIVEKMNGRIWVESETEKGSIFAFEVELAKTEMQETTQLYDGIVPSGIRLLIIDSNADIRNQFTGVVRSLGMTADEADSGKAGLDTVKQAFARQGAYDVIFLDCHLPDIRSEDMIRKLGAIIDKNTAVVMTTFAELTGIERTVRAHGLSHFILKPLFPSSILDTINEVIGNVEKDTYMGAVSDVPVINFAGINILLAEDLEINRTIFITLMEETGAVIDTAVNGLEAVQMFEAEPDKYNMILMDVQMPEMSGIEATRAIRASGSPRAKTIPIIAMTANAFKEDIINCLDCGMNDHLPKPIDIDEVFKKIDYYRNFG